VTGDGQSEAVALLAENSGGSGVFVYLALVANQAGQPVNLATTLLGDRIQVEAITIENRQIVVELAQAGPDDPFCCPSQQVIITYELQGDQLVEVASRIVEEGSGKTGLAGSSWRLTTLNGQDVLHDVKVTVAFGDDGRVTGSGGCNNYFSPYEIEENNIAIGPVGATMMACPDPISQQETAFFVALDSVATYELEVEQLVLQDTNGQGVATFAPVKTAGLPGSSWLVRGYNNGKQAVVSVIIGTELTAIFTTDGNLNGSSGCNTYNSSYQVDGESIAIGPAITTLRACAEPEGIMAQEEQYLAALQTAATYKINGERLEMRTAAGSKVADFVAAVTGQVTYLQRIALPPEAVVKVQLQDVSLADAPATVIGQQIIPTDGQQVPFPFEVTFDPSVIQEKNSYSLNVRVEDEAGDLLFINTRAYPVITQDNPTFGIEVLVDQP
jgi:heat shock protein HslJ